MALGFCNAELICQLGLRPAVELRIRLSVSNVAEEELRGCHQQNPAAWTADSQIV